MSNLWNPNDAENENEEDDDRYFEIGREGVIFLVDAASVAGDEDQFRNCWNLIEITMMNRIIQSDTDLIGVVLYNTQHSPLPREQNDTETQLVAPKCTAIFMHMSTMSKGTITYVKHMKESEDFFDFNNYYGVSTSENFAEALWLCSRMFMRCGYKLKQSSIILFSNNYRPYQDPSHEFDKCIVRAKDLRDLGVHFMVVPMIDDDFNMDVFYKEFICSVNDLDPEAFDCQSPSELRDMLSSRIFRKDYRSSCLRYFSLNMGHGLSMGCGLYSFAKDIIQTKSVHLLANTNEIVMSRRTYMSGTYDDELMEVQYNKRLLPGEQRKVMEVGGQKIIFTPDELTKLKSMVEPGMRLLGFKPMKQLPSYFSLKTTKFIYPSEKFIKGSKKLFRALWEKCIEHDKYAICVFAQIRKVAPRYVALVPQQRESMENDGFQIVYLPMQTDIRNLDIYNNEVPEIPENAIEAMKKLTKKLRFNYKGDIFENPFQKMFYATLEALVFDHEGETIEDSTLPDIPFQDRKIQPLVDELTDIFGKDCAIVTKRPSSTKANGEPSAKVPKASSANRDDIVSAISTNNVGKITVSMLKEFLSSEGVSGVAKLTKPALIAKVKSHCNL